MNTSKNKTSKKCIKKLVQYLLREENNQAYERSLYFIMNAIRRGGHIFELDKELYVFAKSYDKEGTFSLIYLSNPASLNVQKIKKLQDLLPRVDIFVHHLFYKKMLNFVNELGALAISHEISNHLGSYKDENSFPQVVLDTFGLQRFNNSWVKQNMYIDNLLAQSNNIDFKQGIYDYTNAVSAKEARISNICIEVSRRNSTEKILIKEIVDNVLKKWFLRSNKRDHSAIEYCVEPINNLISLMLDEKFLDDSGSRLFFRANYDLTNRQGGFWIGEYLPSRSLLLPHVVLTDYSHKGHYRYMLFDIVRFAYERGIRYVNLGGSEEENLYKIKSGTKSICTSKDRKVHSVYIGN